MCASVHAEVCVYVCVCRDVFAGVYLEVHLHA